MMDVSCAAVKLPLETQLGSWLYQTQLWPIYHVSQLSKTRKAGPTAKDLSILFSKVDDLVCAGPAEYTLLRFGSILQ